MSFYIREQILDEAKQIVTQDRNKKYGSPEDNFSLIAEYWSLYHKTKFTPHDVAMMLSLLKIARIQNGAVNKDNYIDLAGYSSCAGEIATRDLNRC